MSASQKFLFDTAFDEGAGENAAKPLPTYTDDDLAQVRDEAFHAGHEAALVEARELEERRIKELFAAMSERIDILREHRDADTERAAREATEVAVTICRKVLPEMARRHALTEIEGLVSDCLSAMPEEPRIVVRVADDKVDALQMRITEFANGFDGKLVLLGDDEMAPTDCAVVWADGGTERNLDRLWRDIDSAIDRLLSSREATDTAYAGDDTPEGRPAKDPGTESVEGMTADAAVTP